MKLSAKSLHSEMQIIFVLHKTCDTIINVSVCDMLWRVFDFWILKGFVFLGHNFLQHILPLDRWHWAALCLPNLSFETIKLLFLLLLEYFQIFLSALNIFLLIMWNCLLYIFHNYTFFLNAANKMKLCRSASAVFYFSQRTACCTLKLTFASSPFKPEKLWHKNLFNK